MAWGEGGGVEDRGGEGGGRDVKKTYYYICSLDPLDSSAPAFQEMTNAFCRTNPQTELRDGAGHWGELNCRTFDRTANLQNVENVDMHAIIALKRLVFARCLAPTSIRSTYPGPNYSIKPLQQI